MGKLRRQKLVYPQCENDGRHCRDTIQAWQPRICIRRAGCRSINWKVLYASSVGCVATLTCTEFFASGMLVRRELSNATEYGVSALAW